MAEGFAARYKRHTGVTYKAPTAKQVQQSEKERRAGGAVKSRQAYSPVTHRTQKDAPPPTQKTTIPAPTKTSTSTAPKEFGPPGMTSNLADAPTDGVDTTGWSSVQKALSVHTNPYLRALLPFTAGDIPAIKDMSTPQKQALSNLMSAGVVVSSGIGASVGKAIVNTVSRAERILLKAITGKAGAVQINAATKTLVASKFAKTAAPLSLVAAGGAIMYAAGQTFFGQWGQAEAPESPMILMNKFILQEAIRSGDWTLYNEGSEATRDLISLSVWEEALLKTPLSPIVGVPNKIEGVKIAMDLMDKFAKDMQLKQENGETDEKMWSRINQEKDDMAAARTASDIAAWEDFARRKEIEEDRDAAEDAAIRRNERTGRTEEERRIMQETADFWIQYQKDLMKMQEEERIRQAQFWLDYKKLVAKMQAESGGSRLSFGLL